MWIRKTKADYKKEKIGLSLKGYFYTVCIATMIAVIDYICSEDYRTLTYRLNVIFHFEDPQSLNSFLATFIAVLVICFFFALGLGEVRWLYFFGSGNLKYKGEAICNTCYSIVERTEEKTCGCGGTYEPLDNWKWEEDLDKKVS